MKVFMPRPEGLCSDKSTAGMVPRQQIPQEKGNKITGMSKNSQNVEAQTKHSRFC